MKWSNQGFEDKYLKQINRDLINTGVIDKTKRNGVGKIEAIKCIEEDQGGHLDLVASVRTIHALINYHLKGAIKATQLDFAAADKIQGWLDKLPGLFEEWKVEKAELDKLKRKRERELEIEREIEEEERKLTLRYNKRVAKALDKVNNMEDVEITDNFYTALGWLAKHTTSISATMPDFMENWFIGKLGRVRRSIVSSDAFTSGGYAQKWSLSMSLRVDTLDHLPGYLIDKVKKNKVLNNTRLVFELCDRYGFKVGDKTQDITTIKENIPTDHIEEFEIGVNS